MIFHVQPCVPRWCAAQVLDASARNFEDSNGAASYAGKEYAEARRSKYCQKTNRRNWYGNGWSCFVSFSFVSFFWWPVWGLVVAKFATGLSSLVEPPGCEMQNCQRCCSLVDAKCSTVITSRLVLWRDLGVDPRRSWRALGASVAGDHAWSLVGMVLEFSSKTMFRSRPMTLSVFSSSCDAFLSTKSSPSFLLAFFLSLFLVFCDSFLCHYSCLSLRCFIFCFLRSCFVPFFTSVFFCFCLLLLLLLPPPPPPLLLLLLFLSFCISLSVSIFFFFSPSFLSPVLSVFLSCFFLPLFRDFFSVSLSVFLLLMSFLSCLASVCSSVHLSGGREVAHATSQAGRPFPRTQCSNSFVCLLRCSEAMWNEFTGP